MYWPYTIALALSGLTAILICIMAWQRRSAPGGRPLIIFGGAIAVWALTYAAYFLAQTEAMRFFWLRATYVGVLIVPTAFFLYSVQYVNKGHWLKKRVLAGLSLEPFLTFIFLWTDPFGWFFGGKQAVGRILDGGPWFWVNVVYSYALIAFALILLVNVFFHTKSPLRHQPGIILIGGIFPWVVDILGVIGVYRLPNVDLTPVALSVTCLAFTVGLSRYRLLDIVPIARDALIENMDDGVIVLDVHNRVVDINSKALWMVEKDGRSVIGEPIDLVLSEPQIINQFNNSLPVHQELIIGKSTPVWYDLRISPLYDRKKRFSGRLIVARNITERRQIELTEHEQRIFAEALRDTALALSNSHSFEEALDRLLDNVTKVIPYDLASFMFLNEHGLVRMACCRGYRENGLDCEKINFEVGKVPQFQIMMASGEALVITDTRQSNKWTGQNGLEDVRSYVGVPLKNKDVVIGFLDLASKTPYFYGQSHAERLQVFADQVSIAIENIRLFEETRKRAEQMTALFDIGLAVTSGLDMEQVLRTLLAKCQQVLTIEAFYIAVLDAETGLLHHPLAYDLGEYPRIPTRDIRQNPGLSGYIINTQKTLHIRDLLSQEAETTHQIFRTSGTPTRSFVGVPMMIGEQVVGVISMQSYRPDAYDQDQIRLLETIATQAAVAIENSRLYQKAQLEIKQREQAERRYRALFEQSHDAVFILDFKGKYLEVNQRAADMLGYSVDELMQMSIGDITTQNQESNLVLDRIVKGEHIPTHEGVYKKKNQDKVIVEINTELVRDDDGTPIHIQSVVRDISERKQNEIARQETNQKLLNQIVEIESLQAQLREQATRDSLTGLFNRRHLEEALAREFDRAKRDGSSVCLIMMDIDGFKAFNDTYGHDAGDLLLRKLGGMLKTEVRSSDISCRYGGEEFLVVMPGTMLEDGYRRAEHLREAFLSLDIEHMGSRLLATLSLGVAVYPIHGDTWETVIHNADRAMYAAKAAGKNCTRKSK